MAIGRQNLDRVTALCSTPYRKVGVAAPCRSYLKRNEVFDAYMEIGPAGRDLASDPGPGLHPSGAGGGEHCAGIGQARHDGCADRAASQAARLQWAGAYD